MPVRCDTSRRAGGGGKGAAGRRRTGAGLLVDVPRHGVDGGMVHFRGREFLGPRQVLLEERWAMELRWRDHQGDHRAVHRPGFVAQLGGGHIAIELDVTRTLKSRLRATLAEHAVWRARGLTGGVLWVCVNEATAERIANAAADAGLYTDGGGLRIELVDALKAEATDVLTSAGS